MEHIPYLNVRHTTLNQYPRSPAVRQHTLVRQTKSNKKRRNMSCEKPRSEKETTTTTGTTTIHDAVIDDHTRLAGGVVP